ncbi:MAG: hypothetical protein JWM86_2010 [Thermoleophilia bacterium]|nr:hypothetical protein [Thermoleophilia bacterium]
MRRREPTCEGSSMAAGRTIEPVEAVEQQATEAHSVKDAQLGFGAEYRELARQRRFVRSDEPRPGDDVPYTWHAAVTAPAPAATAATPTPAQPAPTASLASAEPVASRVADAAGRASARISSDHKAMLGELARMSDRLVESREQLATALARAEHAEATVAASNGRLMAAQALVMDAQRATRESAERCAWLEGRCESLGEALELAVNASMLTRWRWRRQQRAAQLPQ